MRIQTFVIYIEITNQTYLGPLSIMRLMVFVYYMEIIIQSLFMSLKHNATLGNH